MSWVRWSNWTKNGVVQVGQMRKEDVSRHINKFGRDAAKLLKESGADHVLYAVKEYGEDGELEEVRFYMEPMTDEQFEKSVANRSGVVVYAHHARK